MTAATDAAPAQNTSKTIFVVVDIVPALKDPPAKNIASFGICENIEKERRTAPIIFKYFRVFEVLAL